MKVARMVLRGVLAERLISIFSGYMFFSCGLSQYYVGFFHLANHAYFKALLFLSAGSVIHSINDNQDS